MFEEIKEKLTTLFKLPIKEITYEEINYKLRSYEGIKYCDDYGNLLHAVVSNKYDEEKTFKFIEELLSHGYDVNYKNKSHNHNFIQWAFYGYTENDEQYSHSTEFIVKLINIAKKYGLDVNAKDSYGSNIIHMALNRSTYEGQVFSLLDALGEDFDFECKDGYGRSLLEIIDENKKYAREDNDEVWFNRCVEEEKEFKKRILGKGNASDDKTKNSSLTTSKVETDINTFETTKNLDNYADTDETVKDVISEEKEISDNDECERKQVEEINKTKNPSLPISKEETEINTLETTKNLDNYANTDETVKDVISEEEKEISGVDESERKQVEEINKTKDSSLPISKEETEINTLETTKNLDNYIDTDETVKDVISEKKEISGDDKCERKQVEKVNKTIKSSTDSKKEPIENQQLIIKENPNIDLPTRVGSEIDLSKLSLLELKQLSENIVNMINIKKQEAITERQNKLEESIDAMLALEETGLYERSELEESIENVFSKKVKIKCRKPHNN